MRLAKEALPNATPFTPKKWVSINEIFWSHFKWARSVLSEIGFRDELPRLSFGPAQDGLPVRTRRQGSEQLTYLLFLKMADERNRLLPPAGFLVAIFQNI
jgi:hypothetical protein